MNSEAGASHVRKQLFHEDEYRAFRIALDVKETDIVDFWNNIDQLKSKKEFLRVRKELENKILKKKDSLQERKSNYTEKGAKDKNIEKNICGSADMEENVPPASENDFKLKGGSTGVARKKNNQRKKKKTDCRHASVTDATNTIHSGSDDVMREGEKSKGTRVFAEKGNLTSQKTGKVGEEASKKKGKKKVSKSEIGSGEKFIMGDENQKPKEKCQVQLKEKKKPIKQKENLEIKGISSNFPGIEEKGFEKEKRNAKKKTVSPLDEKYIEEKRNIKTPRKRNEKIQNLPEVNGKDIVEKTAKLEGKKVQAKKTVLFKDGEEKISEAEIKGKDAGNQETMMKKSKNKKNKAVEDENIGKVEDQKKATLLKKSRNCKTVKSSEPKMTKKKVLNKKDEKFLNQDEDKVNKKCDVKFKNENGKLTEIAKNIESDHELMKWNISDTDLGDQKYINYHSEKVNTVPFDTICKQKDLSSEEQFECTEATKLVTLKNIDQSSYQKWNVAPDMKNIECGFQDKNDEKPSLTEVIKNQLLFEKKINNSENTNKSVEELKKSSVCAFRFGENKSEKPEKGKTYEMKQEAKRIRKEIRKQKKLVNAVKKLSEYVLPHLKKLDLDSNPKLKHNLNIESDSDSDSDSDFSDDSSDIYCSECSCSSACSCSCCSEFSEYSSSDNDYSESSSTCSCSSCQSSDCY